MWLKSVQLKNIKSFADSGKIEFSPGINLLVGPNNGGKSILTRTITSLLQPLPGHPDAGNFLVQSLRCGSVDVEIDFELEDVNKNQLKLPREPVIVDGHLKLRCFGKPRSLQSLALVNPNNEVPCALPICHQKKPNNFLFPYFSRRKPAALNEGINSTNAETIEEALKNLPAKVDQLSDSKNGPLFNEFCQKALGFIVSCVASPNGKQIGLMLTDETLVPVTTMGEGTFNIIAFLVHLCSASGNLFLIEEIENDLHPAVRCVISQVTSL